MNKSCPVCGAGAQVRGPVSFCHCCDHAFQTDLAVRVKYDQDYVDSRYGSYPTTDIMSFLRAGFLRAYVPPGALLDVGYGNGAFARAAEKCGYTVAGVDVHGHDYGVTEHALSSPQHYQVVTFFDSLEHFQDLEAVRELLGRTNYAMVSFPCRPRWFPSDLSWKHYRPGEHLHYFSSLSILRLFSRFHLLSDSDLEDSIRGKLERSEQNIQTMVFKRVS